MVLQETGVFRGTIFDNIAYGKESATMDEVVAAAKAPRIHNYIMRLPQGYNTIISEDGGNISKGQKQLLTIARAMLYDTNMLILDEAASNVDINTERQVQKAIRSLMAGKTCFVIAFYGRIILVFSRKMSYDKRKRPGISVHRFSGGKKYIEEAIPWKKRE